MQLAYVPCKPSGNHIADVGEGVPVVHIDDRSAGGPWFVGGRSLQRLVDDMQTSAQGSAWGARALGIMLGVTDDAAELLTALAETVKHRADEGSYLAAALIAIGYRMPVDVAALFPQVAGADVLASLGEVGRERALQVLGSDRAEERWLAATALRYCLEEEVVREPVCRRIESAMAIEDDARTRDALSDLIRDHGARLSRGNFDQVSALLRRQDGRPDSQSPAATEPVDEQRRDAPPASLGESKVLAVMGSRPSKRAAHRSGGRRRG